MKGRLFYRKNERTKDILSACAIPELQELNKEQERAWQDRKKEQLQFLELGRYNWRI